ncbi:hypothetical protein P7K49_003335, partial [Saguinus oedipus]
GRCPGPKVGSDGRGAPLSEAALPLAGPMETRDIRPRPLRGGMRARKRTARPGGPAGWEDGGGSPGRRRRGENPG